MNNIPIIKIALASFSLMVSCYKKIIEISIVPIGLMLPLLFTLPDIIEQLQQNNIQNLQLQPIIFLYGLMFTYGYAALNINLYRVIVLGNDSIFKHSLMPINISLKFILLSLLISVFNLTPIILKIPILEPIIFILIAHLMLNLVIIATQNQLITWNLSIINRLNIALLQFIIPLLISIVASIFGGAFVIIAKFILIYWSAINLALIFNYLYKV